MIVGYDQRPSWRGASGFYNLGNHDACVPLLSGFSKFQNLKGTDTSSHLTMPRIKTWHSTFRSFTYQVFVVQEDEGFIPFGFSSAQTPRTKSPHAKPYRDFMSQEFRIGMYWGLASRYPWCRHTETSRFFRAIIIISGFRKSEFHNMCRQEVSHLGFPGAKTPKPVFIAKLISWFHKSGLCDWRVQGN
jgi:hypothetical protein